MSNSQWEGGKGSKQRPTNKTKFDENWEKIFGKKKDWSEEKSKKNPTK